MIAVEEHHARAMPEQRGAVALPGLREAGHMPGEFDSGTQQRGGERIAGKDQNVLTAHVAIR